MKSRIGIIFWKEFREIFRDKRTVFSVVVSPLVMTPGLLWLMGTVINGQVKQAKTETLTVGLATASDSENSPIVHALKQLPGFQFVSVNQADAEAKIKNHALKAVAILPANLESQLTAGKSIPVQILLDEGNETSRAASTRLNLVFDEIGKKVLAGRLKEKGLPSEFATPFKVEEKPIAGGGSMATFMLAMLLPYTLAVAAFGGGIYAANDQVAGEKERGTLETLLVTPASRRDIVLGKFLAVAGVCLVSSFLAVLGMMIPFLSRMKAYEWLAKGGVSLSPTAIAVTLIMQFPLAVLFAGVLLALSTFARNQKEAQTYLAPLFIVVLLPAMMSMFVRSDASKTLALIPVLNSTLIIKQALSNVFDPTFIALAFAASVLYAGIALLFATRLFQKEGVLIKT